MEEQEARQKVAVAQTLSRCFCECRTPETAVVPWVVGPLRRKRIFPESERAAKP